VSGGVWGLGCEVGVGVGVGGSGECEAQRCIHLCRQLCPSSPQPSQHPNQPTQPQIQSHPDFGLSIDITKERPVTRVGTLDYMAPEGERSPLGERRFVVVWHCIA